MIKKLYIAIFFFVFIIGCSKAATQIHFESAGLLVTETINDQVWGTKGYKGMLRVQSELGIDVFYKEGISSKEKAERAIKELSKKKTQLIFGHGNEYSDYFNQLANKYPDIHFVSFNGDATFPNTTSLSFEGRAMGFFGGMTAAYMSANNKIGVLADFDWQPEVIGFLEGATFQNPETEVLVEYTGHLADSKEALVMLDKMLLLGIDVVYPAGEGFAIPVIEKLKEKGLFAIGHASEQSDLGHSTVLTSTVRHVDKLYELIAKKYSQGELTPGKLHVDFQEGVISMGEFSPLVDKEFQMLIKKGIDDYIEIGKLPSEK